MSRRDSVRTTGAARAAARLLAVWAALTALVLGVAVPAADASTPPTSLIAVHGFLTQGASADLLVVNYTITVQNARPGNAQLTTRTFPGTPVDLSTVQFQGNGVPSGTVTQNANTLTVRVGLGADSVNGGLLGTGSYLLSYEQRRPTGVGPYATTSATLGYSLDGDHASVTSNALPLTHPDLALTIPSGSGEDRPASLGTGRLAEYVANLTNRGTSADAVNLTLALPTGLRLDPAAGILRVDFDSQGEGRAHQVPCSNARTALVTCKIGGVGHDAHVLLVLDLVATSAATPGTTGTFRLSVAPAGEPDQHATDNALAGRVTFTGVAVLHFTVKAPTSKVVVGKSVKVTLSIHNDGPQPAGETFSIVLADSAHFKITKFATDHHVPGPDYVFLDVPPTLGGAVAWNAGTIRAHSTVHATLTLKAMSVGTTHVEFGGDSDAADPGCDHGTGPCHAFTTLALHAVKAIKR